MKHLTFVWVLLLSTLLYADQGTINLDVTQPFQAHLNLHGLDHVQPAARQIGLSNPDVTVNNSLEQSHRIDPRESNITLSGPAFDHTFPGYSLTVLRVKTR